MAYDKKQINLLFTQYVETKDDETFEQLIVACDGMIDAILLKCQNFSPYFEDLKQEVKLKMWTDIRKNPKLPNYLTNPHSYLLFRIRRFINVLLNEYAQMFDIKRSLSDQEETAVDLVDKQEADFGAVADELGTTIVRAKEIYQAGKRKRDQHELILFSELSPEEERVVLAIDKFLDPEKRYLLKEALKNHYERIKQRLLSNINLGKDSAELERTLAALRQFLEEDAGI